MSKLLFLKIAKGTNNHEKRTYPKKIRQSTKLDSEMTPILKIFNMNIKITIINISMNLLEIRSTWMNKWKFWQRYTQSKEI